MRTLFALLVAAALFPACGGNTTLPQQPLIQPDRRELNYGADFGNAVLVGTSVAETLQLKNGGKDPLEISSVTVTGDNPGLFTFKLSLGGPPASVESLKILFIEVIYSPKAVGKHKAKLVIVSNSSTDAELTIPLNATAQTK